MLGQQSRGQRKADQPASTGQTETQVATGLSVDDGKGRRAGRRVGGPPRQRGPAVSAE